MIKTLIRYLFLFCLIIPVPVLAQDTKGKNTSEVIILHVNDMHSKIDNMAKLAYLADSLRNIFPYVFLVSAGDNFTGNPVVDMIEEKGFPMVDLMNQCGFNVSAVGNHEFDMGQAMLNRRMEQAQFPFICANFDASGAVLKPPRPFEILKAGESVSMAFLGLIQLDDNGLPSAHPNNMKDIRFTNGLVKAKEFAWLKERHGIFIALSHLGLEDDRRLADSLPMLDLIIGGHTHALLEQPEYRNNVMIVQVGSNLRNVGKITLTVEEGKILSKKEEVISLASLTREKPEVRQAIDRYNHNPEFSRIVGTAKKPVEGEDELGSLMTDALTEQLKVDFAFQNRGGIRVQSLPQGNITLKEIYKLDPFNNQVVLFAMTPDEIKSLICYGFEHEKGIDLQVSGMLYTVETDATGACRSVKMTDRNGRKLDPKKEYMVAMNNYMATTYRFEHKDPGTVTTVTTAEALIQYLGTRENIDYSGVRRVKVIK